ncbi:MAG: hypothetical protein WDO17_22350 [Alphaproteobacteria bacterium]
MLKKSGVLAALTLAGAALFIPDATFARGGMGGFGGFRGGGLRAPAVIHRAPFMVRTGPAALGRNGAAFRPLGSTLPPPIARQLPVTTHVGRPFAHFVQRHHGHHRRFVDGFGYAYPFTTWDDGSYSGSYIGVPYDPGASIPVYAPAPVLDPPLPGPAPRLSGMRDDGGEACRSERVTVPGGSGDREITVVRC